MSPENLDNIRVLLNRAPTCNQLHPPPPTSTQLHPPPPSSYQRPPSSTHLHSAHFSLNPALWNTLNNIWTKMLHITGQFPQNIGRKTKRCPFWLKIGTHHILEVLIPNPHIDFWNSDDKNSFWDKLGARNTKFRFSPKIGAPSISRILILNPDWIQNLFLVKFEPENSKLPVILKNWYGWYLKDADSCSNFSFLNFKS